MCDSVDKIGRGGSYLAWIAFIFHAEGFGFVQKEVLSTFGKKWYLQTELFGLTKKTTVIVGHFSQEKHHLKSFLLGNARKLRRDSVKDNPFNSRIRLYGVT